MNEERLLKLAKFLREEVPDEAFDFSTMVSPGDRASPESVTPKNRCNTVACAMGWLPVCFPQDFRWSVHATGVWDVERRDWRVRRRDIYDFFDLNVMEAHHLFYPGRWLNEDATAAEVADEIERFVREKGVAVEA